MKIANTSHGARVSLTDAEYAMIGKPNRADVHVLKDGLVVEGMKVGGSSVYHHKGDATHPWAFSLSNDHAFRKNRKLFGAEHLHASGTIGGSEIKSPLPRMDRPVINKTSKPREKKVQSTAVVTIPATSDEAYRITLDAAVEFINKRKDELGSRLVIEVDEAGYLAVLQRSGR